jgi:hypothetical protein
MTKISLDVESVLANAGLVFLEEYNKKHGTAWDFTDWTTWDFGETDIEVPEFLEISKNIWQERWEDIPACETGLADTTDRLYEHHDVDIVTARVGCDDEIQAWLDHHNITAFDEFRSCEPGEKVTFDYDIFIDDKPGMHEDVSVQYMPMKPYNTQVHDAENVIPVMTVCEAVNKIIYGGHNVLR